MVTAMHILYLIMCKNCESAIDTFCERAKVRSLQWD